jgi:hypothetical protein
MVSGRGTSDIDFLSVTAVSADDNVEVLGGLGSDLHKKYRVYLQYVGIATPPCDYADRLQCMFPGCWWAKLQLFALDPIDLALYKLERNSDRDREDVLRLAQAGAVTNEWLIDGLLILAQSDHGLEVTEPVALDALVRQVLAETLVPNGLSIRHDLEPAIVEGDAMLL